MDTQEIINCINKTENIGEMQSAWFPEPHLQEYYFVSYSHKDYKKVYADIFSLQNNGIPIWYDRGMPPSKSWKETAQEFIDKYDCKGVIFYVSENSLQSEAIHKELEYTEKCGKQFLIVCLPIEQDYIYGGKRWKGSDGYSPKTLLDILNSNNVKTAVEKYAFIAERLDESVICARYSENIDKKIYLLKKLQRPPLIVMKDMFGATYVEAVEDINIKTINESDFVYKHKDGNLKNPNNLLNIFYCAFSNCRKLKVVDLPEINVIFQYAFYGCVALEKVNLSKVCEVWDYAFMGCEKLASINVTADSRLEEVGNFAFSGCKALVCDLHFPDGLVAIGEDAFSYSGITKVVFGERTLINSLGDCAFRYCKNLKEVIFPNKILWRDAPDIFGVRDLYCEKFILPLSVFAGCQNLKIIKLPNCLRKICRSALFECVNLAEIRFGGTRLQWLAIEKQDGWDKDTGDYIVYCSDGEIPKSQL